MINVDNDTGRLNTTFFYKLTGKFSISKSNEGKNQCGPGTQYIDNKSNAEVVNVAPTWFGGYCHKIWVVGIADTKPRNAHSIAIPDYFKSANDEN